MQGGQIRQRNEYIQTFFDDVRTCHTLMLWQRALDRLEALDWHGQMERNTIT